MVKQTFGDALRAARLARGWSQTDLAMKLRERGLKTDHPRVSDWEHGRAVPGGLALAALVVELGLPIEALALLGGGPGAEAAAEGAD